MAASMETRWLLRGDVPDAIQRWFRSTDVEPATEERDDHYLLLAGLGWLTIKLRDDKIEAKRSEMDHGVHAWHEAVAGRCVQWHKWSYDLAEARSTGVAAPDAAWLTVHKRRDLRKIDVSPSGAVAEVPAKTRVEDGCMLELSRLAVREDRWWSVCFEAFGAPERLRAILDASVVHAVATAVPEFELGPADSQDYAPWLSRYATTAAPAP
jgi:hypothetical protein